MTTTAYHPIVCELDPWRAASEIKHGEVVEVEVELDPRRQVAHSAIAGHLAGCSGATLDAYRPDLGQWVTWRRRSDHLAGATVGEAIVDLGVIDVVLVGDVEVGLIELPRIDVVFIVEVGRPFGDFRELLGIKPEGMRLPLDRPASR